MTSYFGIQSTAEGRDIKLAMQELWIGGEILPIGAKLVARHIFASAEKKPIEVIYTFMLPRDAALRQFRIEGEGFSVVSELNPVKQSVEIYEKAMAEGKLTGLTQGYRDGITSLMIGNLQPGMRVTVFLEMVAGVEAHDDGFRFRFPFTIAPGYHPEARVSCPSKGEAEMELPEEKFGDIILPPWREDAAGLHRVGFDLSIPVPGGIRGAQSPSHPLSIDLGSGDDACRVSLATEGDLPNRDLVLDIKLKGNLPLAWMGPAPKGTSTFAAWIPSTTFGKAAEKAARVAFVVDRSGSMAGDAMTQALRALRACLGALSPEDAFTIVAFDDQIEAIGKTLLHGDQKGRDTAETFIGKIDARGGTELQKGVFAAAEILGDGGGDIFLITDGQVYETETIINRVRDLGLRVHVLGIGSASQDRFLSQLARQSGGESRFLTAQERIDEAAVTLFSSLTGPVAHDLRIELRGAKGDIGPIPPYIVFAGNPVTVFGEAKGGAAALAVHWNGVEGTQECQIGDWISLPEGDDTIRLLRGARLISDTEARAETEKNGRTTRRVTERLESLGREYGLASRAMSLVAVTHEVQDRSGTLAVTRIVPVGMPQGMDFDACFQASVVYEALPGAYRCAGAAYIQGAGWAAYPQASIGPDSEASILAHSSSRLEEPNLMEIASQIESDGGLPGANEEKRIVATLFVLMLFKANGQTPTSGIYSRHVSRMVKFLENAPPLAGLPASPGDMVKVILTHLRLATVGADQVTSGTLHELVRLYEETYG